MQFKGLQAAYIKTQPLHSTQQTIEEEKDEFVIELKVTITYELIEKLLSFGAGVKVLAPASLQKMIADKHREAADLYSSLKS